MKTKKSSKIDFLVESAVNLYIPYPNDIFFFMTTKAHLLCSKDASVGLVQETAIILTCSQAIPSILRGRGRTLPRPRASRFLRELKRRSSRFSSSLSPLQYRASLSCGGNWWRSCFIRYFSPTLLMYGILSSGRELMY